MMKTFIATAVFLALGTAAMAQGRPSTTRMTCGAAARLVAMRGAVVLGTGGQTYDRIVRNEGLCPTGLYGHPAFAPTLDNPQCNIGFYCAASRPFGW
jgi:hypothetical protein